MDADLTVAVLARHRPEYLREMLDSIVAACPAEAIVEVRDHSDDDRCQRVTEEVAAEHRTGPVFRHLHTSPRGVRANISGAVAECKTSFLCILNDDDLIEPALFSELLPAIAADADCTFATGVFVCIDARGRILPNMRPKPFTKGYVSLETMDARARFHLIERQLRPAMGTIFRTDALRTMHLPAEAPTIPDLWIARHMMEKGLRGYTSDAAVFRYRVHSDSMSGAVNDLAGYRWSIEQFLNDPAFASVIPELRSVLRSFERSVLLGQYVRSDRSSATVRAIIETSAPTSAVHRAALRVALTPPISRLSRAYLRWANPRLRDPAPGTNNTLNKAR